LGFRRQGSGLINEPSAGMEKIPQEYVIPPYECFAHPLKPMRTNLRAPLPTNSFYSDLFLDQEAVLLFPHPYVLRLDDTGVAIQKPHGPDSSSGSTHARGVYPADVMVSFEEWWGNAVSFLGSLEVLECDFASVNVESVLDETMVERGSSQGKVCMPITRGMAYVTFLLKDAKPRLRMRCRRKPAPRTRFNASDQIRAEDYIPQATRLSEYGAVRWNMPIQDGKQICVWFFPNEEKTKQSPIANAQELEILEDVEEVELDFDAAGPAQQHQEQTQQGSAAASTAQPERKAPFNTTPFVDPSFELLAGGLDLVGRRPLNGVMRVAVLADEDCKTCLSLMDHHSPVFPTGCTIDLKLDQSNRMSSNNAVYSFNWQIAAPCMKDFKATSEVPLLHFALPHHQQTLASVEWTELGMQTTTKGYMRACLGKAWHFSEPLLEYLKPVDESGWIPGCWQPPHPIAKETLDDLISTLQQDADYLFIVEDSIPGHESQDISTYFKGKALFRIAQMCLVAEGLINRLTSDLGNPENDKQDEVSMPTRTDQESTRRSPFQKLLFRKKVKHKQDRSESQITSLNRILQLLLERLKQEFQPFLDNQHYNSFLYDTVWGGIVPHLGVKPQEVNGVEQEPDPVADFGSSYYNDHHYHWGYLIHTAAILAHFQREWGERPQVRWYVENLVRDTCNPDKDHQLFPFSRSFDWWSGHCWSRGLFPSPDGKDLESISEEINLHYSILLWGQATSQRHYTQLGISMVHLLMRSSRAYVLMAGDDPQCAQLNDQVVANKVPGIYFEGRMEYRTWFGNKVEFIHGIQMIPMLPISEFVRRKDFSEQECHLLRNALKRLLRDGRSAWGSILLMGYAVVEPKKAFTQLKMAELDDGLSRSWGLYWAATRPNWK